MTTIKQLALTFFLICLCALLMSAQAQTPRMNGVNISAQADKVQISAEGEVAELRVDVANESGEVVFQSGQITGQQIDWQMTDAQGVRVAPGTYLVTVTFRNAAGKLRKRVEQVIVDEGDKSSTQASAAPQAAQATVTTSNPGVFGSIARFTGDSTIANSVITQTTTGRIGIGTDTPGSKLTVVGGGSTVISGVNNVKSSSAGSGVSGTGAPGADGSGGGPGTPGGAGIVGQGGKGGNTSDPVGGVGGAGIVGTGGSAGSGSEFDGFGGPGVHGIGGSHSGTGVVGISGGTYGIGVQGLSPSGFGVVGFSNDGYAGFFEGKVQINGNTSIPIAKLSFGEDTRQMINLYQTTYGIGVQASTFYFRTNSSFNWYRGGAHSDFANNAGGGTRLMRLGSGGDLTVTGQMSATNFNQTSDRHAKANFSSVNSRVILSRLASIPIQTWSYKSEETEVRHIGPTAQDFRAAFNLGTDDKHISTVDADGVTMAAIQGLYQIVQEKDRQIEQQSSQIETLTRKVEQQQAQLNQVKRTIKRKQPSKRR
jgi:hypothetical protein